MNTSATEPVLEPILLTQYSHGAGCGCKIAPSVLEQMLKGGTHSLDFPGLLVGNASKDDAAVFDLGNGLGVISTTDFFMPIVDDAFDFGVIASVNAISDVYAMGGTPLMAIAVLGWPVNKLGPEVAARVIEGGREACRIAGIPLAGGHSIDSPEPIFGLAVTGTIALENLKKNDTAKAGCKLYLTKPLGVGILTTMVKQGKLGHKDLAAAVQSMQTLNKPGEAFGKIPGVTAMTDVTGFGLLGHLLEMCEGSGLTAQIDFAKVPIMPQVRPFIDLANAPGGTTRNWNSYGHKVLLGHTDWRTILADPQTSGGLLCAVLPEAEAQFRDACRSFRLDMEAFGELTADGNEGPIITVK
jgi:selenide,water dikinase